LPMIDNVRVIANEPNIINILKKRVVSTSLDFGLPEGYVLAIYDLNGNLLSNSNNELSLHNKLSSLDELGLPPIKEFPIGEPILPKESIKLKNKEFVLVAMACISPEDNSVLGAIVIGKIMPSAPADISSMRRGIIAILALSAISIFLIALWISSLIAKEITEPIRELVLGTYQLSSGNLDYKVDISAEDEIKTLADSFNIMAQKLRQNAEELKRAEKSAAWQEVAQKLAHEIKNPLTPIQLSAERLKRRYYSKPEGYEQILDECTETIIEEVEKLRRILDEFSQFARMPAINPILTNLNDIVMDSIKLYSEIPENIELITQYDDKIPNIMLDPDLTKRAFFNIIKNAIEAMENGGKLLINTQISENNAEIEFSDTGNGMSDEEIGKLFTPHFSTKRGGAGLGLTIVKKIIDDQNGNIKLMSEEGKGTTFIVSFPIPEVLNCAKPDNIDS